MESSVPIEPYKYYPSWRMADHASKLKAKQLKEIFEKFAHEYPKAHDHLAEQIESTEILEGNVRKTTFNYLKHIKKTRPEWYVDNEYVDLNVIHEDMEKFAKQQIYLPAFSRALGKSIVAERVYKKVPFKDTSRTATLIRLKPYKEITNPRGNPIYV